MSSSNPHIFLLRKDLCLDNNTFFGRRPNNRNSADFVVSFAEERG